MPSTVFNKANEIYEVLQDIGVGKKMSIEQLRDIISITAGANYRTIEQYCKFLEHFKFIKIIGIGKFEILRKETK
jgi:predicted transcriptional regulator